MNPQSIDVQSLALYIACYSIAANLLLTLLFVPIMRWAIKRQLQVTTEQAVRELGSALDEDEQLYDGYRSNLSSSFQETAEAFCPHWEREEVRAVALSAASDFLRNWIVDARKR